MPDLRRLTCATLAASLVGVLTVSARQLVFRGTSDIVRVFVTVTDQDGQLITTLGRQDFEVRDEGKPQPITRFDTSPQPLRLTVMLDASASMESHFPQVRAAAEQLFVRLRPDDVARVGTFGHTITISPSFTSDPEQLRAALPTKIAPKAPSPLWRALDEALDAFNGKEEARAVILLVTDGRDTGPTLGQRSFNDSDIIERAREQNVTIYAIGMYIGGVGPAVRPGVGLRQLDAMLTGSRPDAGLVKVTEHTGGDFIEVRSAQNLGVAFAQVANELHSQFLVGFAPPKRDGKVHDIDVRVTQKGLQPRARKSYVAPQEQK